MTGTRAGRLGDLTWPVVRDYVVEVITVSEEDIVTAMRVCYERMKARCLRLDKSVLLHKRASAARGGSGDEQLQLTCGQQPISLQNVWL